MNIKPLLLIMLAMTACQTQPVIPTNTPTLLPTQTSLPTVTTAPTKTPISTETPAPIPSPGDIFGAIPIGSVQAFSLEPVAKAIFDQTLQGYVDTGTIQEYRVDSLSVFPSGEGALIAEIMYSLRTDDDPWPEDFGTPSTDGWITGKCSRFDFVATVTEQQLKNKRLCS